MLVRIYRSLLVDADQTTYIHKQQRVGVAKRVINGNTMQDCQGVDQFLRRINIEEASVYSGYKT